mmetsp:Transcript_18291/g.42690  ORF Transcript_18291/g.42690 Transcript_18291/m.42690 type:complete len:280 (-) Transcript_18291:7347-8186(-)
MTCMSEVLMPGTQLCPVSRYVDVPATAIVAARSTPPPLRVGEVGESIAVAPAIAASAPSPSTQIESLHSSSWSPAALKVTFTDTSSSGCNLPEVGVTEKGPTCTVAGGGGGRPPSPKVGGSALLKRHQSNWKMPVLRTLNVLVCVSPFSTGPKLRPLGGVAWNALYTAETATRIGGTLWSMASPLAESRICSTMASPPEISATRLGLQVTVITALPSGCNSPDLVSIERSSLTERRMPSWNRTAYLPMFTTSKVRCSLAPTSTVPKSSIFSAGSGSTTT